MAEASQKIYVPRPMVGDVIQVVDSAHPAFALLGVVFESPESGDIKFYNEGVDRKAEPFRAAPTEVEVIGRARRKRKDFIQ